MVNEKGKTLKTIDTLSEDEIYALYLKSMLKKSEDDIKKGKVMTVEESIERMKKEHESFNIDWSTSKYIRDL